MSDFDPTLIHTDLPSAALARPPLDYTFLINSLAPNIDRAMGRLFKVVSCLLTRWPRFRMLDHILPSPHIDEYGLLEKKAPLLSLRHLSRFLCLPFPDLNRPK